MISNPNLKQFPFITVVVPVRNEEKFIESTLRQLLAQNYPADRYEIIVADGESTDRTPEIVSKLSQDFPHIILINNPNKLSSSGRNIGFKTGKGDYFLVIDGHCVLDNEKLLSNIAELFISTKADCLCRPQPFILPEEESWQRAIAIARASKLGHSNDSYIHSTDEGYFSPISSGCAYKRDVFEKVGYVDETFDAAEDVEFNYRVEQAGLKSFFSAKIMVKYFPRENLKALWKQLNRYGKGRVNFTLKHPHFFQSKLFIVIFFILFLLFGYLSVMLHPSLLVAYLIVLVAYIIFVIIWSSYLRTNESILFIYKLVIVFFTIHFGLTIGLVNGFIKSGIKRFNKISSQAGTFF